MNWEQYVFHWENGILKSLRILHTTHRRIFGGAFSDLSNAWEDEIAFRVLSN